ncbi:hypothetical protein [Arsenophonus sp. PmNCSU2021_1]|uniref:hypothetical protein n=1 Tax=Arsenophonus sp. PmNCSU2021_1 TaxID=3118989 RepID=UPI002FF1906F
MIGLRITNPDGSFFYFNENTTPATNIWTKAVDVRRGSWTCPNPIPQGYKFVISRGGALASVRFVQHGNAMVAAGTETLVSYSESNRLVTVRNLHGVGTEPIQIIAYPDYNKIPLVGSAGLKILGSAIFLSSLPITGYSYAFHKKIMIIDGVFNPVELGAGLTPDNAIYFFYSTDVKNYIGREPIRDGGGSVKSLRISNIRRNSHSLAKSKYYVIAFRAAKSGELETKGCGLKLRNIDGNVTFNSQFNVMTKPVLVPSSEFAVGKGKTIPGIKRPMYTPQRVGDYFWHTDGGYLDYLNVCQYSATSLGLSRYRYFYNSAYIGETTTALSSFPVLVLDAEDYFKF